MHGLALWQHLLLSCSDFARQLEQAIPAPGQTTSNGPLFPEWCQCQTALYSLSDTNVKRPSIPWVMPTSKVLYSPSDANVKRPSIPLVMPMSNGHLFPEWCQCQTAIYSLSDANVKRPSIPWVMPMSNGPLFPEWCQCQTAIYSLIVMPKSNGHLFPYSDANVIRPSIPYRYLFKRQRKNQISLFEVYFHAIDSSIEELKLPQSPAWNTGFTWHASLRSV